MIDALMPWFKFIHVATIAMWSAGLIALPMLYHQRRDLTDKRLHRLHSFTRFFYVALISPAAFVAVLSGTVLIFMQSTYESWFSIKLVMVAAMTGIHIYSGLIILKLFEPDQIYPTWRLIIVMPLTLVVIALILALVLAKPEIVTPEAVMEFFAPGALSKIVTDLIGAAK
ncbi:CopD family protein [Ahrensia sp. 13_GOM-1096m]|uniref:CopD family protein n=1 Tax=Ahrensia sp. 13_GOM-1096m TaxID=1380380 RepID=UPI0009DDCB8E|nr:CopD family protein [Ahrensia sp. 13_GOM-1096m]